jgi:hypothetical protein
MANESFFLEESNFGEVQDAFNSTHKSFDSKEGEKTQEIRFFGADEELGLSWSNDPQSSFMSPPLETCLEEISKLRGIESGIGDLLEHNKEKQLPFSLASLQLLQKYGNGLKRLNDIERRIEPNIDPSTPKVKKQELSTEEIMKIAGARFIQSSNTDVHFNHPFDLSFSSLSASEAKNMELAELLFSSAEKLSNQQFNSASRLLDLCDFLSSNTGNPVQRLVYYFSRALRERELIKKQEDPRQRSSHSIYTRQL